MAPTAYQHRPLSSIIAQPSADKGEDDKGATSKTGAPERKPEDDLPEKYRGKTAAEIAEMHRNSERRLGELQNEVGHLRGLVSDLAQVQRQPESKAEEPEIQVSGDDVLSDPVGAIRKVVEPELSRRDREAQEKDVRSEVDRETQKLYAEFGDLGAITSDPEFQEFATRTVSRQMDLQTAANGDGMEQVRAARRLLEDYNDFKSMSAPSDKGNSGDKTEKREASPVDRAREVSNEANAPSGKVQNDELIYEADVLALIQSDPNKYRSPSFQKKLTEAIKEGRYVKQ